MKSKSELIKVLLSINDDINDYKKINPVISHELESSYQLIEEAINNLEELTF